jgi:hypothetical protein
MLERYALVSSLDGTPARFFIFDTKNPKFPAEVKEKPNEFGTSWLMVKNKKIGLIVRTAKMPIDLIASLGISKFYVQPHHTDSLLAVEQYDPVTHIASGHCLSDDKVCFDLFSLGVESVWIREPYVMCDAHGCDNMEIMCKLMMFEYNDNPDPTNSFGYNNWSKAIDPWTFELNS